MCSKTISEIRCLRDRLWICRDDLFIHLYIHVYIYQKLCLPRYATARSSLLTLSGPNLNVHQVDPCVPPVHKLCLLESLRSSPIRLSTIVSAYFSTASPVLRVLNVFRDQYVRVQSLCSQAVQPTPFRRRTRRQSTDCVCAYHPASCYDGASPLSPPQKGVCRTSAEEGN